MENTQTAIIIETTVKAPIEKIWKYWIEPEHITRWCNASEDWHAPAAENDLRVDGKFKTTMAAKDGSVSFDFEGVYTNIQKYQAIEYTIADGRRVKITFTNQGDEIKLIETFEPESIHPLEMQREGWQAILNNFKKYTEAT